MAALCMIQGARVVATHASFMYHTTSSSSSPGFPFQARSKQPLNPSSLLLPRRISKVGVHSIQEPKRSSAWSSQTDSNDQQETAPTGKNQVSKVEKPSEESGGRPPVLTIVADFLPAGSTPSTPCRFGGSREGDDRKLLVASAILLGRRRNTSLVL